MAGVKGRSGGKNRIPSALKALRGTLQPCRSNPDEPKPPVGVPPAPEHLDDVERRRYEVIGADLVRDAILTLQDGDALAQLARAVVHVERLVAKVRIVGEFEVVEGSTRLTAEAKALAAAEDWLAKCNARFGRDPQARASVKRTGPPKKPAEETERDRLRREFGGGA